MPAEIFFKGLSEARVRLADMPRDEIEALGVRLIFDCLVMSAGILEVQHLVSEAREFLKNSDLKRADKRLAGVPALSGYSPNSVPPGVSLQ